MAGLFTVDAKHPDMDWPETETGHFYPQPHSLTAASVIRQCSASVLHDGYVLRVGAFVLFSQGNISKPSVGRVTEILADVHARRLIGVLIQEHRVGEVVLPYRFPALSPLSCRPIICTIKVCLYCSNCPVY